MHTTTTPTTTQQLQTIARLWPDLLQQRTTRPHDAWPPSSLQTYLRTVEEYDPADRSAPVRLHIIDTIRTITVALVDTADQIAAQVQRQPMSDAPANWPATDRTRRNALAHEDRQDPARWPYTGTRTAPAAALWLHARIVGAPGPCTALTGPQHDRIAHVADHAAQRLTHALGTSRRTIPTGRTCGCGGELLLDGGDGHPPVIRCGWCSARTAAPAAA
ncbi:hypothetical protein [Streptomyces sp. NPDC048057]|uniref:hypothetical protein n=1 Tax=Streptomyces sp. NPDC048057 TaxID=3155628 RepID=UPI0033CD2DE1